MTTAETLAGALLRAGAVHLRPEDPFTFASGLRSPIYCDNRLLIGDVAARRAVIPAFAAACAGAEVVAGTATAGIPWAAWAAEALALPMAYVRGAAKGHGRGRQIEGAAVAGRRVALLEDTISTGESALAAAAALRAEGAELTGCVCIFTWGWGATRAAFDAAGLPLLALTTLPSLLAAAAAAGTINAAQRVLIDDWVADPQGWAARQGFGAASA
ncbi:orotate phosphoribosyltransferase [Kouleothrix sp.]|uniref:orotate phosphoribosyltransferase n=1 Tax=Kouleothrix sp. TaxID=2779161 RepID=UPI00391963D5